MFRTEAFILLPSSGIVYVADESKALRRRSVESIFSCTAHTKLPWVTLELTAFNPFTLIVHGRYERRLNN